MATSIHKAIGAAVLMMASISAAAEPEAWICRDDKQAWVLTVTGNPETNVGWVHSFAHVVQVAKFGIDNWGQREWWIGDQEFQIETDKKGTWKSWKKNEGVIFEVDCQRSVVFSRKAFFDSED